MSSAPSGVRPRGYGTESGIIGEVNDSKNMTHSELEHPY